MIQNTEIVRWLYMRLGDMLEYKNTAGIVKQIGPIVEIDWRANCNQHPTHTKKYVLVTGRTGEKIDVPLMRVQAIIRDGIEVIRIADDEQKHTQAFPCQVCHQRSLTHDIPGKIFCSLACQQDWIEKYYSGYQPGTNPVETGEYIHTANCAECRRGNRGYCTRCVD